jgi:hypothetical protein
MASWMDALKLPIREIESKYTLSELVLMGWHSRLQSYNMSKRFAPRPLPALTDGKEHNVTTINANINYNPNGVKDLGNSYGLPNGINNGVPVPKKFFNEEGELDLRLATGPEAVTYLRKLGIQLTMPLTM